MLKVRRDVVLKQYGLPRSGTNYTKFLIESNYFVTVLCNRGGWKHGRYQGPANTDLIVTTKHPISWLVSIWNRRSRFDVWMKRHGRRMCIRWNNKNNHWLNLNVGVRVFPIRYEDLLLNPNEELDKFGWHRKSPTFIIPKRHMIMGHETTGESSMPFDPSFYLEHRYFDLYSHEDFAIAKKHLDGDLMERLGYKLLGRPNGEALPW